MKTIFSSRRHHYVARVSIFLITVALIMGIVGCGGNGSDPYADYIKIYNWTDLDNIRNNLVAKYVLMNDLDSTTAGYEELASPTANGGKGWDPIGNISRDGGNWVGQSFLGTFDGQGYEIRDLFVDRPNEDGAGLFSGVDEEVVIKDTGVVNAQVTGDWYVGGLVGTIVSGTVSNCYFTGSVSGTEDVGGLVGWHENGGVVNSYCSGNVTGGGNVGGLVGTTGKSTLSNSYFSGTVSSSEGAAGLVGWNYMGIVSNSYYNYDEVLINGQNTITVGALYDTDFEQWFASDKFLDVNERLSQEDGYYLIENVSDFKQLLAFGQDASLKFRLTSDLDLEDEANFYIPYLAGTFDGNGHKILNLALNLDYIPHVGLFGFVDSRGTVSQVSLENVSISGGCNVGGLVGSNRGTVRDSYSSGSVTGKTTGGLVGDLQGEGGTLSNSYSTGSVTGEIAVGGLVGEHVEGGTVSNSYYNYDEVLINGENVITIGALFAGDFEQWLANGRFLDVNERLSQEDGYYLIENVSDFKQLLAFGEDSSLRFRLENDLNLTSEPGLFIPYLAGEFDGNGHKISNLSFNFGFVGHVGLFGVLALTGRVQQVGVESINVTAAESVGGLVGANDGTVSKSYSTGMVSGTCEIGGLVGYNSGGAVVSNSYSSNSVGNTCGGCGGLVGRNYGHVSHSYSTGNITCNDSDGGLVGVSEGYVSHSFWDTETSGQATSDGGTGKTTAEMQDIATFSGATWDIFAVANSNTRHLSYVWNIVDDETYPFLSWEPVS